MHATGITKGWAKALTFSLGIALLLALQSVTVGVFTALDLAPFSGVTQLGSNFVSRCASLAALDVRPESPVKTAD